MKRPTKLTDCVAPGDLRALVTVADLEQLLRVGLTPPAETIDSAELAAWTSVTRALLNLNETITRN